MTSVIIVMGVAGCGKSTVGKGLADKINWPMRDGDEFHSETNKNKMKAGIALTDSDRFPWLHLINRFCREQTKIVIACSALKKVYRSELERRVSTRKDHFMAPSLLESQLATLDLVEVEGSYAEDDVIRIDGMGSDEEVLHRALAVVKTFIQ